VKYSYAVAEHLFIVELPAGKENWIEDLDQCYAPFLVTTHDEDKALFKLSAELGDIVAPSAPYWHVASVQPTDLAFEVWSNEKGDYAIIVSDDEGTSESLVYTDASFRKASVVISRDAAKPSVLLNNAVEGAVESYQKQLEVAIIKLDLETLVVIQNSCKKRKVKSEDLFELGFSTKGRHRGLGLNNVKEILGKYDNVILETEIDNDVFKQVIRFKRELI